VVKDGSVSAFDLAGQTLAISRNSLKSGDVMYADQRRRQGSPARDHPERGRDAAGRGLGRIRAVQLPGWNNETVHGYVVKPWNYQPGKKYPVAFLIHGGPQGSFGNGWSYRWNPQTYAGKAMRW
jgi:dipeptidyl aminopeptidase/acylaminoacyl peptidase